MPHARPTSGEARAANDASRQPRAICLSCIGPSMATAIAGIDAEWRVACTKRAETDAAEREAWEARLREGAAKPKDS
jgi:hypothetical protein